MNSFLPNIKVTHFSLLLKKETLKCLYLQSMRNVMGFDTHRLPESLYQFLISSTALESLFPWLIISTGYWHSYILHFFDYEQDNLKTVSLVN